MHAQAHEETNPKALEDIRTKVVPILGLGRQADEMIAKVAVKHNMGIERVVRIAKNMKAREKR